MESTEARRAVHIFFFNDTAPPEIYTLSLHDALPILIEPGRLKRSSFHWVRWAWARTSPGELRRLLACHTGRAMHWGDLKELSTRWSSRTCEPSRKIGRAHV